jgi:UDP-N-acetylmuramate--alanine ligase
MNKVKVGIFFGGRSREREVSFAGGRTVYDNLDKSFFEPIPVFIDSFNQFIIPEWKYIYKGTIRDFYPPVDFLPSHSGDFQIYADSFELSNDEKFSMASSIGKVISPQDFTSHFDIAFLALHGSYGEDGTLQGLLDWYDIPYTGSGIFGTALGINKKMQKQLRPHSELYSMLPCASISEQEWFSCDFDRKSFFEKIVNETGLPLVVKSANQGSSIGVSFVNEVNLENFCKQVDKAFFRETINLKNWVILSDEDKNAFIRNLIDLRGGLGLPVEAEGELIYLPNDLIDFLDNSAELGKEYCELKAFEHETEVLFEPFVRGKEFSCIVLRKNDGSLCALPPTEIVKKQDLFDYRAKYLPGLSRKITPMSVDGEVLTNIRRSCEHLTNFFDFKTYARIDGFLTPDNVIYLNDPNTTSGMMPSSFFFHQAAEIGLTPTEFITYVIKTSIQERIRSRGVSFSYEILRDRIDNLIANQDVEAKKSLDRIAVVLGGNSFERHISIESGRNVFEKLKSSGRYEVTPIFLDYSDNTMRFFLIPISVLLKDNADDIREKAMNFKENTILSLIRNELEDITDNFVKKKPVFEPKELTLNELKENFDGVFLALHGRPGEDGTIQKELDKIGLYYNGSGSESSAITIDKFKTIQVLSENGFPVTQQLMIHKDDWLKDQNEVLNKMEVLGFPLILKPHDDGCSAAVLKIKNREGAMHYTNLVFRNNNDEFLESRKFLGIKVNEEFPCKEVFLAEKLISSNGASHFIEITGGMLSYFENGEIKYLVFEPSEALAEGEVLSLEEKFLAGQGQNITPARYASQLDSQKAIAKQVKAQLLKVAQILNIQGYCRIDAFVRIFEGDRAEVIVIEVNSLPGMTPATCIYHQAALEDLKPFDFIHKILEFGKQRLKLSLSVK